MRAWPPDDSADRGPLGAPVASVASRPDAQAGPPDASAGRGLTAGPAASMVSGGSGAGRLGIVGWLRREMLFASVLVGVMVGLTLVYQDRWRRGMLVVGVVLALAGLARLVLPTRRVGLLAVRGRAFDTVILMLFGAAVITLTSAVPYLGP
ncbi:MULTISPECIES: DUF3017 domain-containing protein [Frankia]|uniref:DUF3017 domain-containing protein n=2 Tax=Frankiaceae TaxID=74712 RepID=UPI00030C6D66|nr:MULTISPECIES: DUF3017 domain-containing protein [Frankia]